MVLEILSSVFERIIKHLEELSSYYYTKLICLATVLTGPIEIILA